MTTKFISTKGLVGNKGTIAQLQRIVVFDANVFIMLDYCNYIHGERCYEEAMKLLKELGVDYKDGRPKDQPITQLKTEI